MIFHGFRINKERTALVWAPHYHTLGFIRGGFDVCRSCVHESKDCRSCSEFKGREVREYAKDRYLVKVLAERKTVFGTGWYQLNHATVRVGLKRFHTVTWFGVCGNRKFKSAKHESQDVCPACSEEMVRCAYRGTRRIAKDVGAADYKAWFVDDELDECGSLTMLRLKEVEGLSSGSSERRWPEPKCWLKFEDVAHCPSVESFNAFVEQFLSERVLDGESRKRTYWALFYAWKNGISSGC